MRFKAALSALAIGGVLAGSLAACGPPQMTLSEGCSAVTSIYHSVGAEARLAKADDLLKRGPSEFPKADLKIIKADIEVELGTSDAEDTRGPYLDSARKLMDMCG